VKFGGLAENGDREIGKSTLLNDLNALAIYGFKMKSQTVGEMQATCNSLRV
jgi:hypothetical protein